MNRFPQEQGGSYSRGSKGARLSSVRMLHSGQGRKIAGSVVMMSFADFTQSIPHTGHFMLLPMHVPSYKGFQIMSKKHTVTRPMIKK